MIIRDAIKDKEIESIRDQRAQAYQVHKDAIPAAHFQALLQAVSSAADLQSGVDLIVAEQDGAIVGSVALFPPQSDAYEGFVDALDYSEIRMLAVSPEAQGQGVASALIKECIKRTKESGFDAIGLHTGEFMTKAIRLYEKFGFERLPQYDFEPANDGIIVKAFRLSI